MAVDTPSSLSAEDSYRRIGNRIQKIVAAPGVQKTQAAIVSRAPDENEDMWNRVLSEIAETDGVDVDQLQDGTTRIGWRRYLDS